SSQAAILVTCYLVLEWLSILHQHNGVPVTPWNPGLGLMFAAIILKGRHYGIVFFIGIVLSEVLLLSHDLPWPAVFVVGVILATAYTIVAEIARRHLDMSARQVRTKDIIVIAVGGLVGASIASAMLAAFLRSIDHFAVHDIATTAAP